MASDVRSLLRNERLARRVDDPHAAYSAGGRLSCTVCNVPLKADTLWAPHTKSKEHRRRLHLAASGLPSRPADAAVPDPASSTPAPEPTPQSTTAALTNGDADRAPPEIGASKKRKADDSDDERDAGSERHKKARPAPRLPADFFDGGAAAATASQPTESIPTDAPAAPPPATAPTSTAAPPPTAAVPDASEPAPIDEDEWAAFQRDVVASPSPPPAPAPADARTAPATIEAAPVSAAELAARSREEASVQRRERRQEEAEGEREDAQVRAEEEFEEMERLEERVRRLKERREALRGEGEGVGGGGEGGGGEEAPRVNGEGVERAASGDMDEDGDEDDEYDDFEGWGRR